MKILKLCFQNLNSLRGVSEIDFESAPLGTAGLFAITGPTGAGKSTLLDAMTLALYGKAARYGTQPSPETMMSRHTGECFAELEFSCAGGRFRSSWHLQRAHKKPGAKLQNPKRRVIALPAETVLSDKGEESGRMIEQLTGLDYERFLRSVMLAQGDFAAFLKAKPDDRANLLEQVTGTTVYRDISVEAFQRFTRAKEAHALLLGKSTNIQVLTTEEREQRLAELTRLSAEVAAQRRDLAAVQAAQQAAQRRLAWEQADRQLTEARQALESDVASSQESLARLALGEKARALVPALAEYDRDVSQLSALAAEIGSTQALLPGLKETLTESDASLARALQGLEKERLAQEVLQALWLRVQQLDTQVEACLSGLQPMETQRVSLEAELEKATRTHSSKIAELAEVQAILQKGNEWLAANAGDASLGDLDAPARLASQAWAEASRRLAEATKCILILDTELAGQARSLELASTELLVATERIVAPLQAAQHARAVLDRLLPPEGLPVLEAAASAARKRRELAGGLSEQVRRLQKELAQASASAGEAGEAAELLAKLEQQLEEARARKDLLEKLRASCRQTVLYAERCAALVQERPLLQDGRECPLCGALHHPWAHLSAGDSAELAKAHAAEKEAEQALNLHENALVVLQTRNAAAQERAAQATRARDKAESEAALTRTALAGLLLQLGLAPEMPSGEFTETLVVESVAREEAAESRLQECRRAQENHLRCSTELHRLQSLRETVAASHLSLQALQGQLVSQRVTALATQEEARADELARKAGALKLLGAFVIPSPGDQAAYSGFLDTLQQRARLYTRAAQKVQDQLQKQVVLDLAIKTAAGEQERLKASLGELQARLQAERLTLEKLRLSRTELFGTQLIETSRHEARQRLAAVSKVHGEAEAAQRAAQLRLATAEKDHTRLAAERLRLDEQVRTLGLSLEHTSVLAGFAGVPGLRAALLSEEEFKVLSSRQRNLEERRAALDSEAARLERELTLLPPGALEDSRRLGELASQQALLEARGSELSRSMGAHEECIRIDDTNRTRLGTLLSETEAAHREFARWDALRALIGAADGSLFARFAQGLTLDRLAWLANAHLVQLNPRYSVRRVRGVDAKDLELEIMDHFQADVVRPMGSLSGGESFLVSLALALALSELASGRSTIESLFIDEGFGSLDLDTLEAAMAALEALQSRGKTIGVISHVAVMQERISTQIRVIKESGGCSRIMVVG